MSDKTTPRPACFGPEPMTAERRAEIRADRCAMETAEVVELLAEVDRLRALWADVAKTARNRKAEAEGRRQHAEKLNAKLSMRTAQLELQRTAIEKMQAVEAQAIDYVDDLNQQIAEADQRAEQAEAEQLQLTQRIPYKDGETDEEYLHRQIARWRSEAYDARVRASAAEAERDRLDVRIDEISRGFSKANRLHPISEDGNLCANCKRPYPCPTVTALSSIDDHASEVIAERDQLKAANDRAKALANNATRTGCGAGWDLNPAEVLAVLDLPAVRAFAAKFDPRGED